MIDMTKYKFYEYTGKPETDGGKQTVCAVSTYAGKTVKGYAKCNPQDNFDLETGKALAAARCNAKIAEKRFARAEMKVQEAQEQICKAVQYMYKMTKYYEDAHCAVNAAEAEIKDLLDNI